MPDVVLPSVYLDAIVLDDSTGLLLLNPDPYRNEIEVDPAIVIALEIADLDGTGLLTASIDVNGTTAWIMGTGFQAGFSGVVSSPSTDVTRIEITPDSPFSSEEVVTIRVQGTGSVLDDTYTFTVADLTDPIVLSAMAISLNTIRLVYSEPVKQTSIAAADSALNPTNYTFARLEIPSVNVVATSVVGGISSEVDITTDIDLSPGKLYRVTVDNVEDLVGNAITAPANDAEFSAFTPAVPEGRVFDLFQLLPLLNRNEDVTGDLENFIGCLQDLTDLLLFDIDQWVNILDPDLAKEPFLSLMLCDMGNPFTAFTLSEIDKRRLLDVIVAIYKQKGTEVGIINAVRFFMKIEITINQFLQDCLILGESELGDDFDLCPSTSFGRFSFEVIVPQVLTVEQRRLMTDLVNYMKPAHTHLIEIVEPDTTVIDHIELGLSELGVDWELH